MEKCSHLLPTPLCFLINCSLVLLLISSCTPSALSATRRPISEAEIRDKKKACYADIESGLWGWKCRSSITEKENCALRCLSSACYQLIYESDPLEEGEKDHTRNHEYKYCLHNDLSNAITKELQLTHKHHELGLGARIQLANAIVETGNAGATIQFGCVDFSAVIESEIQWRRHSEIRILEEEEEDDIKEDYTKDKEENIQDDEEEEINDAINMEVIYMSRHTNVNDEAYYDEGAAS
ncbi:hypothetical protein M5K25_026469 [Dendrobium thyrsiflorum]|uniref:Uncharacterized protein n=1 Tax=Dendrobium thyrsiflorum TaxID=117978 RepID=A0ABD0TXS7_DENTH